jgi:hypothetical protein
MKKFLSVGLCLLFICGTSVFAKETMVITFTNGQVQTFDTDSILKIEFQSAQPSSTTSKPLTKTDTTSKPSDKTDATIVSLQSFNYQTHFIRHKDYLGEITPISSELDKKDSTFRIVPGLADSHYVSFESVNYPGYYLRHQNFRIKLQRSDGSELFKKDATFKMRQGLANSAWKSFESFNHPGNYIRHSHFHLYIATGTDSLFKSDATFKLIPKK